MDTGNIVGKLLEKLKGGMPRMFAANVINKAISMISSMVITRLLTKNDYGIWGYALNVYSYLTLVTGFGLISGAFQFGTENEGKGRAYSYFRYCMRTGLVIDAALVIICGAVIALKQLPISGAKPFVLLLIPILIPEYIVMFGQIILRTQNRIADYARVLNINSVLTMAGTCGGALFGIKGVIIGRYAAALVSIYSELRLLKSDAGGMLRAGALTAGEKKPLWHYSVFTGASSAMNCLVYALDVTMIAELIKSASDIGAYKVGSLLPSALHFIPSSVVVAVLPTIIYNRKDIGWVRSYLKKLYLGLAAFNLLICGGIILLAPLLIRIVSGSGYDESAPVLRVLTLGYFFDGTLRSLSCNILSAFRRVRYGLFISVTTCILDVVFNYYFITKHGMMGAAYATLFVSLSAAVLSSGYMLFILIKGNIYEGD